ncbi:MAG: 2,3-bisphosphoglycerate-dependent phosphoglycerate mutase [Flavobacterium sp. BFFFF1]|uniref:2,3-bisphosphoglycerate-dependent phosphoglycerate mutase n=1 Tax=Flavobacterium sp. BFFFF1 TaxID=2015557 RepID=UPI000BC3F7D6|nr:2,3-bisphosphoglycerate-dependent phosphoglycerate mutase [Flavobacterium sp. BFFFF1]OYU79760.1 MAG: 2,3-bisphosphoglycerate-dependent phosphoglycerate mutase [Flavobacterium sp. BFFFF1]
MSLLILVRHGQSIYNLENRFTGNLDIGLTALGEEEARQAGKKLKAFRFDMAYTSMLLRARESLRIILEMIGETEIPVVANAALNERMYGSLQGLDKGETAAKYGPEQVEIWRRSYDTAPPDGESLAATYARTVPYYKLEIEPRLRLEENILIVAHGNSLRALMMYLENISPQDISKVNIPTGQPRVYRMDADLKIIDIKYL